MAAVLSSLWRAGKGRYRSLRDLSGSHPVATPTRPLPTTSLRRGRLIKTAYTPYPAALILRLVLHFSIRCRPRARRTASSHAHVTRGRPPRDARAYLAGARSRGAPRAELAARASAPIAPTAPTAPTAPSLVKS
eukprot:scaffold55284_cov31-Phaeocystis_antarctica.AAC.1